LRSDRQRRGLVQPGFRKLAWLESGPVIRFSADLLQSQGCTDGTIDPPTSAVDIERVAPGTDGNRSDGRYAGGILASQGLLIGVFVTPGRVKAASKDALDRFSRSLF
jgi:hypothetical protein